MEPAAALAHSSRERIPYPTPRETGGRLIRHLIRSFRDLGFELPITSHILLACSGGSDSTALAVLLARYGRKVIPNPRTQITLLHVNHGWRGKESNGDEEFVRDLAARLGLGFMSHRLEAQPPAGDSWEDFARKARKRIFEVEADESEARVLTAHTADDVAETMLWRMFTGAYDREKLGILGMHGPEVRPLLEVRKSDLQAFLNEEGQPWREDSTNHEGRLLRSRMRRELMPSIERLFPRAIEALIELRRKEIQIAKRLTKTGAPRTKRAKKTPAKPGKKRSPRRFAARRKLR